MLNNLESEVDANDGEEVTFNLTNYWIEEMLNSIPSTSLSNAFIALRHDVVGRSKHRSDRTLL